MRGSRPQILMELLVPELTEALSGRTFFLATCRMSTISSPLW